MHTYSRKDSNGSPIPISRKCTPDRQLNTDLSWEANPVTVAAGGFNWTCKELILPVLPLADQEPGSSCPPNFNQHFRIRVLTGGQQNGT